MNLPPQNCPECGRWVDVAREMIALHKGPRPEDVAICTFCGEILVFAPDLSLRRMAPLELFTIYEPISEEILSTQIMVRSLLRERK